MASDQITQQEIGLGPKIAAILILLIDGYKKSGGEIAAALDINEATVSKLKNQRKASSYQMLLACERLKQNVESEMRDLLDSKAKEAGMTVDEFTLCCVGRVGHEVLEEFRDKTKPRVETGRRGFNFEPNQHQGKATKVSLTAGALLKKATKK
jgi:hypothetical protein